jgi:hypothetical protein
MKDMPDASTASSEDLARFGVLHVGRNTPDQWESDMEGWGLPDDPAYSGGANGKRTWRIPASRIEELSQRYFGRGVDFDALAFENHPGWVVYRDGYVYFGTTNGAGAAEGVSLATRAADQPDGTIRVDFNVYGRGGYDATDQSWYSCSPEEIERRMGESKPYRTGYAIMHQGPDNDYTGGLVLDSYHVEPA